MILAGLTIGAGLGLVFFFWTGSSFGSEPMDVLLPGREIPVVFGVGSPAPDFELENLAGERMRLSDFQGKPVIVNFWATWCAPCRLEMPAIQERFDREQPDLAVLAVNFDEPAADVRSFVDELGLTFPVLLDPGAEVQRLYRIRGYPTTYFVDRNGLLSVQHIGFMTETQLDQYLATIGENQ